MTLLARAPVAAVLGLHLDGLQWCDGKSFARASSTAGEQRTHQSISTPRDEDAIQHEFESSSWHHNCEARSKAAPKACETRSLAAVAHRGEKTILALGRLLLGLERIERLQQRSLFPYNASALLRALQAVEQHLDPL